jgi:hypothetical protein
LNKNVFLFVLVFALLALPAGAANITFTTTGVGINSSGVITLGSQFAPGVFGVANITGTFADTNNGIAGLITMTASPAATGGLLLSLDGLYNYDNLIMLPGLPWLTSTGGLLFDVNGGPGNAGGAEVNIAAVGSGYQLWETMAGGGYLPPSIWPGYAVEFSVATPEPATFVLLGAGLVGLGWLRRHKGVAR